MLGPNTNEIIHKEISKIYVYPSEEKTALAAANFIAKVINKNPRSTITYATGQTQVPVHKRLLFLVKNGKVDFSDTLAFHLDEYYPCTPEKEYSFVGYLQENVFKPLKIKKENIFIMKGDAKDPNKEVKRYNNLVKKYPPDLVILGIGPGGHLAFNEPGSLPNSETRLITLSKETINRDRKRNQNSPQKALTQGIANILSAKKILLIAYGFTKGKYLREALFGKTSSSNPASFLRLNGKKVTIMIDQLAASQLG